MLSMFIFKENMNIVRKTEVFFIIEVIKKNQMELLEIKNTVSEIKSSLDILNSRLDTAKEIPVKLGTVVYACVPSYSKGQSRKIT